MNKAGIFPNVKNIFCTLTARTTNIKWCFFFLTVLGLTFSQFGCATTTRNLPELRALALVSKDGMWIVGEKGNLQFFSENVLKTDRTLESVTVICVFFRSEKVGWALDNNGQFWSTQDGGSNWTKRGSIPINDVTAELSFFDDKNGVVIAGTTLFITNDGGDQWLASFPNRQLNESLSNSLPKTFSQVSPTTIWLLTVGGKLFLTVDAGITWKFINGPEGAEPRSLFARTDTECWVGGWKSGGLFMTSDRGQTWQQTLSSSDRSNLGIDSITFSSPQVGWALGRRFDISSSSHNEANGILFKTVSGGTHWERVESNDVSRAFRKVRFLDHSLGWLIGDREVAQTVDGGETWTTIYYVP